MQNYEKTAYHPHSNHLNKPNVVYQPTDTKAFSCSYISSKKTPKNTTYDLGL